jgi:hypothetical protein
MVDYWTTFAAWARSTNRKTTPHRRGATLEKDNVCILDLPGEDGGRLRQGERTASCGTVSSNIGEVSPPTQCNDGACENFEPALRALRLDMRRVPQAAGLTNHPSRSLPSR